MGTNKTVGCGEAQRDPSPNKIIIDGFHPSYARYLLSNEAHDKAGAYGIQGYAGAFVERIEGRYTGVMGLPLYETVELLKHFGYPAP